MRRYERWWFRLWLNAKAGERPPRAPLRLTLNRSALRPSMT